MNDKPLEVEEVESLQGQPLYAECINNPSVSCWGFLDNDTFIGYHANFYIQDYGKLWVAYNRAQSKRKPIAPPSEKYLQYLLEKDKPKPPYQDRMVETKYKNDIPVRCPVCHYTLTLHIEFHCPVCGQRFINDKRTPFKNDPFFEEREKRAKHGD